MQAPHWPWSQPFFVPVSSRVSRTQSRSVVRGSIRRARSLPLIRSVTGTRSVGAPVAPVESPAVSPGAPRARTGWATVIAAAAAPLVAPRNARRVGREGSDPLEGHRSAWARSRRLGERGAGSVRRHSGRQLNHAIVAAGIGEQKMCRQTKLDSDLKRPFPLGAMATALSGHVYANPACPRRAVGMAPTEKRTPVSSH